MRLHGVPVSIVSDKNPCFTAKLWQSLQSALATKLTFSTAYHPQTAGQSECTILIIEDMLRGCVLDFSGTWERHLPLVEFAYNNSYQSSIDMAPFEALYGRPCRSPVCGAEVGDAPWRGRSWLGRRRRRLNLSVGGLLQPRVVRNLMPT